MKKKLIFISILILFVAVCNAQRRNGETFVNTGIVISGNNNNIKDITLIQDTATPKFDTALAYIAIKKKVGRSFSWFKTFSGYVVRMNGKAFQYLDEKMKIVAIKKDEAVTFTLLK